MDADNSPNQPKGQGRQKCSQKNFSTHIKVAKIF